MENTSELADISLKEHQNYRDQLITYFRNLRSSTCSQYVQTLLLIPRLDQHSFDKPSEDILFNDEMEHLINQLDTIAGGCVNTDRTAGYYQKSVSLLAPLLQNITVVLRQTSPTQFLFEKCANLSWLCVDHKQSLQCMENAQSTQQATRYSATLQLTAILERSLQDLLWSVNGTTPTMLKEVIQSKTLADILGPAIVTLLDILVGPPLSLNIRNLVWHGFGSLHEHPESFALVVLLVIIMIGEKLAQKCVEVQHRKFQEVDASLLNSEHRPLIKSEANDALAKQVGGIYPKFSEISQALTFAQNKQYGLATILLVTSFEHIARVAFCIRNGCPQRSMTAVSTNHFTTLDHIFKETLSDMTSNLLYDMLPDKLRLAIYDLLYHPMGFRLRDRLSHMEICYLDVTEDVWTYCYNILSTTILYLVYEKCFTAPGNYLVNRYTPLYHPLSYAVRAIDELACQLSLLKEIVTPDNIDIVPQDSLNNKAICEKLLYFKGKAYTHPKVFVNDLMFPTTDSARNLSRSFAFRPIAEWCRLVHAICENLLTATRTLLEYDTQRRKMFEDHTLRGRQRKNWATFYGYKDSLTELLQAMHIVTAQLLKAVVESDCQVHKKHKHLLQLSENLLTFVKENKWVKCSEYFSTFIKSHF